MTGPSGDDFKPLLARAATGEPLSAQEAEHAFDIIMSGGATPAQIGGFLMALRVRGETVEEITSAAKVMRAKALHVEAPPDAIDTCGTGGDAKGTYNVSTACSFVLAACGIPVAKHGNRALSSKTGAADVLTGVGVNVDADMTLIRKSLWENNVGFLMAPRHHSAMRHVGPVRVELATRTIFNLLGPLSNPAQVKYQLVGVFAPEWVEPMAHVLGNLGAKHAWVVHGDGGLDELSTTGPSQVAAFENGKVTTFTVNPADAGVATATMDDLKGGEPAQNAAALRAVLRGEPGPFRDIVLLNSAAALIVAGQAGDLATGAQIAAKVLDDGSALARLDKMVEITNSHNDAK